MASPSECPVCHISLHGLAEKAQMRHVNSHFEEDESTLSKIMNKVSNDVADEKFCTKEIISLLKSYYASVAHTSKDGAVMLYRFSADTWHFPSLSFDTGWGCGYRNIQMLLSCLNQHEIYKSTIKGFFPHGVPSLRTLQQKIEDAWEKGFDPKGREELKGTLLGTRVWIGTTEVAALLRYMGIRSHVVSISSPSGPLRTHPLMFDWITRYFRGELLTVDQVTKQTTIVMPEEGVEGEKVTKEKDVFVSGEIVSDRPQAGVKVPENDCTVEVLPSTDLPPLYLQHRGHSRTVIGVGYSDARVKGSSRDMQLFVHDPMHSQKKLNQMAEDLIDRQPMILRTINDECHEEYEIVFVQGLLSEDEIEESKNIYSHTRIGRMK